MTTVEITLNGRRPCARMVEPRTSLADFIRDERHVDGNASRLRAWRLRRVHAVGGRAAGSLLHHARGWRPTGAEFALSKAIERTR